jgi:hypothetical protein
MSNPFAHLPSLELVTYCGSVAETPEGESRVKLQISQEDRYIQVGFQEAKLLIEQLTNFVNRYQTTNPTEELL